MNYKKIFLIITILVFLVTVNISAANFENSLKVKLEQRPFFLNPIYSANSSELMINREIFDSLLIYNNEGELINNLTEKWEINVDSTVFKFKLKENIYFHPYKIDGKEVSLAARELTAKDLKWSFEYLSSAQNKSPYSDLFKQVKGYDDYREGKTNEIKGMTVIDKYNFSIELERSYAPFIYKLANRAAVIIAEDAVLKRDEFFSLSPVGTGPFKFKKFLNDKLILTRNDNYWANQYHSKKLPYLKELEFNFQKEEDFENNYKNYDIYELNTEKIKRYQKNNSFNDYKMSKINNSNFYSLVFKYDNNLDRNRNNQEMKKNIKESLEKELLEAELNLVQLSLFDAEDNYYFLNEIYKDGAYNPEILKSDADLTLAFNDSKKNLKIGELLKDKIEAYDININKYSWTEYLFKLKNNSLAEDLFMLKIDYKNKFQFLADYFHSESNHNYYNYDNHRVDNLIDYIKLTKNKENQEKAYQIIKDIIANDNPFILIFQDSDNYLFSKKISGLEFIKNSSFSSGFKYLNLEN